ETERQVGVIGLWGRWLEAARLEKSTIGASQAEKPYYIHAPIDTALGSRRRHRTCWALAARDRPANPSHLLPHGAVAEGAVLRHWAGHTHVVLGRAAVGGALVAAGLLDPAGRAGLRYGDPRDRRPPGHRGGAAGVHHPGADLRATRATPRDRPADGQTVRRPGEITVRVRADRDAGVHGRPARAARPPPPRQRELRPLRAAARPLHHHLHASLRRRDEARLDRTGSRRQQPTLLHLQVRRGRDG